MAAFPDAIYFLLKVMGFWGYRKALILHIIPYQVLYGSLTINEGHYYKSGMAVTGNSDYRQTREVSNSKI